MDAEVPDSELQEGLRTCTDSASCNDSICKKGLLTGKGECYSSGTNITRRVMKNR